MLQVSFYRQKFYIYVEQISLKLKHPKKLILFSFIFLLAGNTLHAQKVGLVMSGGGAAGMAHVGVIKALEENNIPIDYIAGTSAGALVGSMYAVGYNPIQLEGMIKSEQMLEMAKGRIENQFNYYFKHPRPTPSIVDFNLDNDFSLTKVIPMNVTDPALIDFYFVQNLTIPSALAKGNFDSLFVPFRCVAADIDYNVPKVWRGGSLSQAVRTSMTFPFYLPPICVDDKVYFDGGLYNNFPTNVLYEDFLPDVIIGSSVTSERKKPLKDDILSQLRSMLQSKSDFSMPCETGLVINSPVDDIGTFDFENRAEAFQRGYDAAMKMMDSIKSIVYRRTDSAQLAQKRLQYLQKTHQEIIINNIVITGVSKRAESYIRSVLKDRNKNVSLSKLKARYFKLVLDDKIQFIFPVITKNESDEYYTLHLDIRKKPMFSLRIGGNFSSRSVNTGYAGLDWKYIDKYFSLTTSANTYFGRFYSSIDLSSRIDLPLDVPFYVEPFITYNRWDYYRSFSAFFEDTKPSFLIKNEAFFGGEIGVPAKNNAKLLFTYKNGFLDNQYYQTDQFISTDTADRTEFFFDNYSIGYEYNTLDAHYLSKKGRNVKLSGNFITGGELNYAGSTSSLPTDTLVRIGHDYLLFKARYEEYFDLGLDYKLGVELEGVHSTQKFFNNYTSTALISPQYEPTQESKTVFIDNYTAHTYLAGGIKNVIRLLPSFDLRLEGYVFQPTRNILRDSLNHAYYSADFESTKRYYTASAGIVFNSPIGPAVLRANYMDHRQDKWSFMFNFNYTLFNRKAIIP